MVNSFLSRHGFAADPFESTNADQEPDLAEYFVPPPYFPSVLGDPAHPQSHHVFAPRGGGKTAQRRMIEQQSQETNSFLCITYDEFDQPPGFRASDSTWSYHLEQICRLMVLAIVLILEYDDLTALELTSRRKELLKVQIDYFLGHLTAQQFQTAVNSLKTFPQRAGEYVRKYSGPIGVGLEAVKKKWGLDFAIPTATDTVVAQDASLRFHFQQLSETVQELGYQSCYVLVDKTDEVSITGTAATTFSLIAPLISDLPTLETAGVAFKFFHWDQIEANFDSSGHARRDRVPVYKLNWTVEELETMLRERMRVYSNGRVSSPNDLLADQTLNLHRLVALLAAGSPRDMIRLIRRIVSEALRMGEDVPALRNSDVWAGVRAFAEERAAELFGDYVADLRRIGRPTFTTNFIGSDIFRISENAARRKLQLWSDKGMVAKVGEIPNPPNRPLYLYGVIDARACLAALGQEDPELLLGNYVFVCPQCGSLVISDRRQFDCLRCNALLDMSAGTVLDSCRR